MSNEYERLLPQEEDISEDLPVGFDTHMSVYYSKLTKIAFAIENSKLGRFWDLFDALVNLALCGMYLVLVSHVDLIYVEDNNECPEGLQKYYKFCREFIPLSLQVWDAALCSILLLSVMLRAGLGMNLRYFWTYNGIVSLLTCLPPICILMRRVVYDDPEWTLSYLGAQYVAFLYPIRWFRLKTSLKVLLLPSRTSLGMFSGLSIVSRKVIGLTITITLMILMVSSYVHIAHIYDVNEKEREREQREKDPKKPVQMDQTFYEMVFFIIMSSTSGLSTSIISIDTWYIQALLVSVLIAGIFYLPPQVSNLIDVVKSRSSYSFPYKPEEDTKHIIITGVFTSTSLLEFLWEFYHSDHGLATSITNAVILHPDEPSEDIVTLLNDPMFSAKVYYIKGSSVDYIDLSKAKVKLASAVFVLSTSANSVLSPNELDSEGLMRCIAVRKCNANCVIYTQCLVPDNKPHYEAICDRVLCIDEMKLGFLAQNCKSPGFITLIHLLMTSMDESIEEELVKFANENPEYSFFKDYGHGLKEEIYCIPIPSVLVGTHFVDAVRVIYNKFHAVVFAVSQKLAHHKIQTTINPPNYLLKEGDTLMVISSSSNFAHKIPHIESSVFQQSAANSVSASPVQSENALEHSKAVLKTDPSVKPIPNQQFNSSAFDNNALENALPRSIQSHIVLCTNAHTFPRSLEIFIRPIRQLSDIPIVILCPSICDASIWRGLQQFTAVYFVKGSPLINKDLQRANISSAKRVVVLASPGVSSSDYTMDATTISTVLNVESLASKDTFVMVDLVEMDNASFITPVDLPCPSEQESIDEYLFHASYMAGNVFSRCMIDVQLCQSFYNPMGLSMLKSLVMGKQKNSSSCFQVEVQENGKSFAALFHHYLDQHGAIAFALYKKVVVKDRAIYLAIPNPQRQITTDKGDKIFLFSPKKLY